MKNHKILVFILIFLLVPINSGCQSDGSPTSSSVAYPDITFYFDDAGQIYSYNTKTDTKLEIVPGMKPLLSHDKTILAYLAGGKDIFNSEPFSYPGNIYLYDLPSKKAKLLFENKTDANQQFRTDQWSPDDHYLTLIGDSEITLYSVLVLDITSGKPVANLFVHDNYYYWLTKNEILYNKSDLSVKVPRPVFPSNATSCAVFNLDTGQEKVIKQATASEDYYCTFQDGKIILTKREYNLPGGLESAYITGIKSVYYYVIDKSGVILSSTTDPLVPQKKESDAFQDLAKLRLPLQYRDYLEIWADPIDQNWLFFNLSNDHKRHEFFVVNKNESRTLRKIGEGSFITW